MSKKHNLAILAGIADSILNTSILIPRQMVHLTAKAIDLELPYSVIQLMLLLNQGDLGVSQISEIMNIAKPNVTPLIDTLEERNYAIRVRQTYDRRMVKVHLLEDGRKVVDQLKLLMEDSLDEVCADLSASEMKELNNALQTVLRLLPLNK